MSTALNKISQILRVKPEVLLDLEKKMEKITGRRGVFGKIYEENDILVRRILDEIGISEDHPTAANVYQALVEHLARVDRYLFYFLDCPDLAKISKICGKLCETVKVLNNPEKGFFLKKEKAAELLEKYPPQNILDHFGYASVAELIDKKGLVSVFSALRFAQDQAWMHRFFDEAYRALKPDDFEEREVELKVLETEWLEVAEKFLEKKYHNLSHLKELGIIFIIPLRIDTPGEMLRIFTLLLHYLNEVPFYSRLFKKFSTQPDFTEKFKSLLRGDVPPQLAPAVADGRVAWRVVQRYLAKDNRDDFRLFEPHINPEVEHWYRAGEDLAKMAPSFDHEGQLITFWRGLDFVGDFFPDSTAGEKLTSFNLIDLDMSLVEKETAKHLYHHQEAMWNKIFIEYFNRPELNRLIEEHLIDGFIVT